MRNGLILVLTIISLSLIAACSRNSPGPLEGKWRIEGLVAMTVEFRSGESEAMGMIDKVTYRVEDDTVFVTYQTGISKGTSMRFRVIDKNTVQSELGTLRRIR